MQLQNVTYTLQAHPENCANKSTGTDPQHFYSPSDNLTLCIRVYFHFIRPVDQHTLIRETTEYNNVISGISEKDQNTSYTDP
jgi:hypothetical protein